MKTNKEIIDSLQVYFLNKCDKVTVARALANCMIDMHRIRNFVECTKDEQKSLIARMRHNDEQLMKFAENGDETPLTLLNVGAVDE